MFPLFVELLKDQVWLGNRTPKSLEEVRQVDKRSAGGDSDLGPLFPFSLFLSFSFFLLGMQLGR